MPSECWVVAYRRYHSDPWSFKVFFDRTEAMKFYNDHYEFDQTDAQVKIKHYVEGPHVK